MRHLFFLFFLIINCSLFSTAQERIFKEYGIRGVVGKEFEIEDSYDIAAAISTYFVENNPSLKTIAVGADGRVHSPAIKKQVCQALLDRGFDVLDIGTCTTPVLYFCLHTEPVDAGLMITASHNPGEYNGFKINLGTTCIYGPEMKKIYNIYSAHQYMSLKAEQGNLQEINMTEKYVDYLSSSFPHLIGANINAIIDCGNGAAGTVLPLLVKSMQWDKVKLLYPEVDGNYPNHVADPTVEKYMQDLKKEILNSDVDFGLGLDGDCDRMAPMTKSGKLVSGDQLLVIYSKKILENNPGSSIVFDVSSSLVLHQVIKNWGGVPILSATGFPLIKKKMAEKKALIGGEISCHTIFKDRYFGYDDGIYSMMRLFELLQETNQSLDQWIHELPAAFSSPLYRLKCERTLCLEIIDSLIQAMSQREDAELFTIDGLRVHFPYGWAIVRASNTEPVISIRFEGNTEEDLLRLKKEFYDLMIPQFDCSEIMI